VGIIPPLFLKWLMVGNPTLINEINMPLVYLFALSYRYILVERHQHAHNTAVPSLELNFEYP
jgi:hypothetical protein